MKKKEKKGFINQLIFILFLVACFLGYKINEKTQWFPLSSIGTWLPYENWFQSFEPTVSAPIQYYHLIDNVYTNGTNTCASLFDGIILDVSDTTITVLHDNGVKAVYGDCKDVIVQVDERILKGKAMGTISDSLTLEFTLNNEKISFEEVMKL